MTNQNHSPVPLLIESILDPPQCDHHLQELTCVQHSIQQAFTFAIPLLSAHSLTIPSHRRGMFAASS